MNFCRNLGKSWSWGSGDSEKAARMDAGAQGQREQKKMSPRKLLVIFGKTLNIQTGCLE